MILLRPLRGFCGCFSLSMGVLVAVACSLLHAGLLLSTISSDTPLTVGQVVISPRDQMLMGSMTCVGVPLAILAGFGTMYHIPFEVWYFYYYQVASFINDTVLMIRFFFAGDICSSVAPQEILRRGPLFICSIINGILLFYAVVLCMFRLYLIFVVWSEAKTLTEQEETQHLLMSSPPSPSLKQDLQKGNPTGYSGVTYGVTFKPDYMSAGPMAPPMMRPPMHSSFAAMPPASWSAGMAQHPAGSGRHTHKRAYDHVDCVVS